MHNYKFSSVVNKISITLLFIICLFSSPNANTKETDLYIYSSRQESILDPILSRFSKKFNYKIETLYISKGILEKLRQERSLSKSDVLLTSDISVLIDASKEGLLIPIRDNYINSVVPENLRASNGEWYGISKRVRLIYSSIKRIAPNEILSFQDLANPKWKGKLCIRSGYHSYNLTLFSAYLGHYGKNELKDFLEKLKSNLAFKPNGNDRFQIKSIWQGKCDISIGNSYYYGLMLNNSRQNKWAKSVRPVFATFGKFGNHINVSGIGILKSVKNKFVALQLIKFLISKEIQNLYAASTFEYPIRTDVQASPLVQSWGNIQPDELSLQKISENRALTLSILKEVEFDK